MPSFDIVSKVDVQALDNAVNVTKREITNRFDFRNTDTDIELDKEAPAVNITTLDSMKVSNIEDVLLARAVKQGVAGSSFDLSGEVIPSGKIVKKHIKVRQGIDKDVSKKIIKSIKDAGFKVQAAIMDDQVRVTAKKIDDLQSVITHLRQQSFGQPMQFVNMK